MIPNLRTDPEPVACQHLVRYAGRMHDPAGLATRIRWQTQATTDTYAAFMKAQQRRNETIQEALDQGWTYQKIADEAGLTRQRIGAIVNSLRKSALDGSRTVDTT